MEDDALLQRLARLPCWRGKVSFEPLKGGLTNLSFVAQDRGEKFVVRCGGDIPVHHVFRDRERAASRAAYEAGLSPELVHVEPGITVLRFIEGRTLGEADLDANLGRLVPLLKTCHREVGRRLWLIDWEYGAFGTAMFDLANLSCHGVFDAEQDEALLAAYFEAPIGPELRGAFAAMKIASELREALWAMVSDIHLKTPGIDYQAYASEHMARFERLMAKP